MYKNQSDSVMNKRFIPRKGFEYEFLLNRSDIRDGKCIYCAGMSTRELSRYKIAPVEDVYIPDVVEKATQNMMYDPNRQARFDG